MRTPLRTPLGALGALALAACTAPGPAPDAGDAGALDAPALDEAPPARPETLRVSDPTGALELRAGGGVTALTLTRGDGVPLTGSPDGAPLLEVGAFAGGPSATRFHDVRTVNPSAVQWRAPGSVRTANPSAARVELDDDRVGPVRVTLERVRDGVYRVDLDATGRDAAVLRVNLASDDGAYHGLGERFAGVDARGRVVPMQLHLGGTDSGTNEHHAPVPFFVNTRGYAVFFESREAGAFDVASTDPSRVRMTFEGRRARVWFFVHEDPRALTAMYLRDTALPRLPPRWLYGPQQWRNEWRDRDELFEDARRLRSEGLPTTTIWIDNPWQRSYNDAEIDATRFPDPPGMLRELQRLGYRVLFWSTPFLDAVSDGASARNTGEARWLEARARNMLVRQDNDAPYVSPTRFFSPSGMTDAYGSLVDFTAPGALEYWAGHLEPLVRLGARAFKLDYAEDVVVEVAGTRPGFRFASGETERTQHSLYPHGYHRAYRLALDRAAGGDGFVMGRASSWGGQAVVDVLWPGDLDNDFRRAEGREVGGLPASITGMLSLAASGFPNFAADTGGYRGGRPTREALLRWAEHTAFSMVLQLGGGGESHNPWSYDAEATALYRTLARAHNDLAPTLYALAQRASRDGTPPVAHASLVFRAPEDRALRADEYAYALGDDVLVFPVVEAGALRRRVSLPRGGWVHWFSHHAFEGPTVVDVPAPLGTPAVFLRAGAALHLSPDDVDTLVDADEPGVVDLADRREVFRVRAVPRGERTATSEDGAALVVREDPTRPLELRFTPGREAVELRAELELAALGPRGVVREASREGAVLARVETREALARCEAPAGCWHLDASTRVLALRTRVAGAVTLRP